MMMRLIQSQILPVSILPFCPVLAPPYGVMPYHLLGVPTAGSQRYLHIKNSNALMAFTVFGAWGC